MDIYQFSLQARSAFGTPLAGDTLFGQLCWAIRERFGERRLTQLLEGYDEGRPFAVVSDAFPAGYLPRPQLPDFLLGREIDPAQRKLVKQQTWLPAALKDQPLTEWLQHAQALPGVKLSVLTQNTINRLTGTTGSGQFAPRQVSRFELHEQAALELYCVVDTARVNPSDLTQALSDIGLTGYGRDASTGLGKFTVSAPLRCDWSGHGRRHAITLAPCAPRPDALNGSACYYQPLTRFGRHGSLAALGGQPFKKPVLTIRTAAFLTFLEAEMPVFHGMGMGGCTQPLSAAIPATVHQGYAPLLPLNAELRP